jgi:hypothetical protein
LKNIQTIYEISDDLERIITVEGDIWSVEPGDQTIICTWLPIDTIVVRLVNPGSVWPYEIKNGDISIRAMRVKKQRKIKK